MAPCVTPLPRVNSTTVISSDLTTRSNTARRVGSASVRITALIVAASVMGNTLVDANSLVKPNLTPRLQCLDQNLRVWIGNAVSPCRYGLPAFGRDVVHLEPSAVGVFEDHRIVARPERTGLRR